MGGSLATIDMGRKLARGAEFEQGPLTIVPENFMQIRSEGFAQSC